MTLILIKLLPGNPSKTRTGRDQVGILWRQPRHYNKYRSRGCLCVWERERKRGRRERRGEEEIAGAAGDKFPRNNPAPAKENKVSTRTRILALAPFRSQHRRVACPTGLRSCTRGNSPNESYPRRGNSSFFFRRLSVSCKARSKKIGLRNFSKGEIFVEIELERLWKCWKFFNAWSKNGLECKFWKRLNDSKRRIVFNPLCPFRRIITRWPSDSNEFRIFLAGHFHLPWINEAAVQRWFLRTSFRELSFFGLKTRRDLIRASRDGRARLVGFYFAPPDFRGDEYRLNLNLSELLKLKFIIRPSNMIIPFLIPKYITLRYII